MARLKCCLRVGVVGSILPAEQREKQRWAAARSRTALSGYESYRVGQEEAVPLPSLGAVCVSATALQTQGKDAPGQSRSQTPGWGAYSYQGSVMGQQAEVANLS